MQHYLHKEACHKRNEDMTKDCDFALMLWNGKSYGTFDDIQLCEKYLKPYKICYYDLAEHMQKYLSLAMEKFKPKLADGQITAYEFMLSKIKSLEITPGQLALDPCSGSTVLIDVTAKSTK